MNKRQVRLNLLILFRSEDIDAWLSNFTDIHLFNSSTYIDEFINYIDLLQED